MDTKEILKFCIEQGILLEPEVLNLLSESSDPDLVRFVLEKIKNFTHNRIITKTFFEQNKEKIVHFFSTLPKENQQNLEKLKIKLGLEIEISKQILKSPSEEIVFEIKNTEEKSKEEVSNVRVLTTSQTINK
ncbi:MAG: hypothetical protein QXU39_00820, partial [Candidatus Pacearchaeota archaeon]